MATGCGEMHSAGRKRGKVTSDLYYPPHLASPPRGEGLEEKLLFLASCGAFQSPTTEHCLAQCLVGDIFAAPGAVPADALHCGVGLQFGVSDRTA